MNRLIEWWARNSVAANLLMVGIFVAGFIGFSSMEREMDPQVRFPGLQIEVNWPGAAPQEVEEQIVARIEEAVSDLDNIEWVRSQSAEGYGGSEATGVVAVAGDTTVLDFALQHEPQRLYGALENGGIGSIECKPFSFQNASGGNRFFNAFLIERHIGPAGKTVGKVPLTFAMS